MTIYEQDTFPVELFRINSSATVSLRDFEEQRKKNRKAYDLHVNHKDGLVYPVENNTFVRPNGASMRPNGPMFQEIARTFKGRNTVVWRVPSGTPIPPELVLFLENSDHYSLQTSRPVTLQSLNQYLTKFFHERAEKLTIDEWAERFPFDDAL